MRVIDTYRFKYLSLRGMFVLLIIPTTLFFLILYTVPMTAIVHPVTLVSLILFALLSRYPHEYAHWLAGKCLGVRCTINFKKINATCVPLQDMNFKQLALIALAPLVSFAAVMAILYFVTLPSSLLRYSVLLITIIFQGTFSVDVFYVMFGCDYRKIKGIMFRDDGTTLTAFLPD